MEINSVILEYILWAGIAISLFLFSYRLVSWIKTYHFIGLVWAKLTKNLETENKIRKENLNRKIENETSGIGIEERTLMDNVYLRIRGLEIIDKIPGSNELAVFLIYITCLVILFIGTWICTEILVAIAAVTVTALIVHNFISSIIRNKELAIESEMFTFINACQCSSSIHPDIIDIFDDIAESQAKCIRDRLNRCVAESKHTRDKKTALKHLRQSSSSVQFASVINALEICSDTTGGYAKTIENLRQTTRIHHASTEKKRALLRNAKMNCVIMATLGIIIIYLCNIFFENFFVTILGSNIGIKWLNGINGSGKSNFDGFCIPAHRMSEKTIVNTIRGIATIVS